MLELVMSNIEIRDWFINRLSESLNISKELIGCDMDFSDFGISSLQSVEIMGDFSDLVNKSIDYSSIYDFPNINELSNHLYEVISNA